MLAALGGLLSGVRSRQFVVEGALSIEARADGRLDGPPMLVQRWHQIRGPFAHTLHPCNAFRVVELALPRLQLPKPVPVQNTSATLAVISLYGIHWLGRTHCLYSSSSSRLQPAKNSSSMMAASISFSSTFL